jgi:hypothetical protein
MKLVEAKKAAATRVFSVSSVGHWSTESQRDAQMVRAHADAQAACDEQWQELRHGPFQRRGNVIQRLDENGVPDGFEIVFDISLITS